MAKDYYNILGVSKGATGDEIKKAYRKLAHQYHPDKEGGDEAKFKEINEAYQVLSDPEKRKMFDQFGEAGVNGAAGSGGMNWEDAVRQAGFGGGFQSGVEFDLGDIFGDIFGGGRGRGRRQSKGQDIQVDMEVDFTEAAFGTKKTIELYRSETCEHCKGNGAEPGTPIKECTNCHGTGAVAQVQRSVFGAIRTQRVCSECGGQGKTAEKKCTTCHGITTQKKTARISVDVPAGIDDGQTIRVSGQGEAGPSGATAGDLYVNIYVKKQNKWRRDGDDVLSDIAIPFSTMALGGKVPVETVDGEVMLKIPGGTQSGKSMRLRGKGVHHLNGSGRGDHIVKVHVSVPKRVGHQVKKLLKELSKNDL